MSQIDQILNAAVRELLQDPLPAGVPEDLPIVAAQDVEPVSRPYAVAECGGGEHTHRLMRRTTLTLRLLSRADEQGAADAALWHSTLAATLGARVATLYADLLVHKLRLHVLEPATFSDVEGEGRAREYEQSWTVWLETVI